MAETQPTWESGGTVSFTDKGVLYSPPTDKAAIAWLEEAARYFENRPTGGEDRAHWANVYNAENCRKIATLLASQEAEIAELRKALKRIGAMGAWGSEDYPHVTGRIQGRPISACTSVDASAVAHTALRPMSYEYIKRAYGLDFAPGQRVKHTVTGKSGEVRREDRGMGHYVMVRFDGGKHSLPCHPEELSEV